MKNTLKLKLILGLSLVLIVSSSFGQEKSPMERPWLVGFQPAITVEPFYEKGEFDINLFPLVVQTPVNRNLDIRAIALANYHISDSASQFSDLGIQTVYPIYFSKKENTLDRSHGFYLGPVIGVGRNVLYHHYTIITAVEPGYLFRADKRFTLSVGVQYGRTFFAYDQSDNVWREHLAIGKVNLVWWLGG